MRISKYHTIHTSILDIVRNAIKPDIKGRGLMKWSDISPKDAVNLDLSKRLDIEAPLNEMGERCPWPWEPQQMKGVPLGQFHCSYCGAMVMAGMEHLDYKDYDLEDE